MTSFGRLSHFSAEKWEFTFHVNHAFPKTSSEKHQKLMFVLFVWFDSLRPINNLSDIKGRVFLGWTSTKVGLMFLLKDTMKWCRWGSNLRPLTSSQALYHWATALPIEAEVNIYYKAKLCPSKNVLILNVEESTFLVIDESQEWRGFAWTVNSPFCQYYQLMTN